MIDRTMAASSSLTSIRMMNERSIFTSLTGSRLRCTSEE